MFINYFTGQSKPSDVQAHEILDIVFYGILSETEREHRGVGVGFCEGCVPCHQAASPPDEPTARSELFRWGRIVMDRRWSGLLLFLLAPMGGCQGSSAALPKTALPNVEYHMPVSGQVTDYSEFPGQTDARITVQVRSRVSGYMTKVYFTDGTHADENQVLFQIDPRPYQGRARAGRGKRPANGSALAAAGARIPSRRETAGEGLGQPGRVRTLRG